MPPSPTQRSPLQRGAGLIETMIGILIGLIVILAIYSMMSAAEGFRRTTTGASDAQITGLLSQFVLGRDAGNGGNGITLAAPDLVKCTKNDLGAADATNRPIPVLVTDSGSDTVSDSFIAMNSAGSHVIWPVDFVEVNSTGNTFTVQSPTGFTVPTPATTPYWVIAVANDGSGKCGRFKVTAASAPPRGEGQVDLTVAPAASSIYTQASPAKLVNLGPEGLATRVRYESWNASANEPCGLTPDPKRPCQLMSTDLIDPLNPGNRNPIAANVVLMKIQYGVDTTPTPDAIVDCWTPANNANVCADGRNYTPAGVQAFNNDDLGRIIAVRIAVVIRSDEPDLKDDTLKSGVRPATYLFNCSANDATCLQRILLPAGSGNQIIQDHWRYRTYETVVALRNAIYNSPLP
jgi:type IV pilus assembly protein PilW